MRLHDAQRQEGSAARFFWDCGHCQVVLVKPVTPPEEKNPGAELSFSNIEDTDFDGWISYKLLHTTGGELSLCNVQSAGVWEMYIGTTSELKEKLGDAYRPQAILEYKKKGERWCLWTLHVRAGFFQLKAALETVPEQEAPYYTIGKLRARFKMLVPLKE